MVALAKAGEGAPKQKSTQEALASWLGSLQTGDAVTQAQAMTELTKALKHTVRTGDLMDMGNDAKGILGAIETLSEAKREEPLVKALKAQAERILTQVKSGLLGGDKNLATVGYVSMSGHTQ